MQHLLYRSRAAEGLPAEEIFNIIQGSARNNPGRELTGFLIFAQDRFVQFLEGSQASLDVLLDDLRGDARHRGIEILLRTEVEGRILPHWRMQRIDYAPGKVAATLDELARRGVPAGIVDLVAANIDPGRLAA